MSAFDALMAHQRETEALGQVMGRLGWDQETMMPGGAAEQRAEEMAALDGVLHGRRTDPRIGEWLEAAEPADEAEEAHVVAGGTLADSTGREANALLLQPLELPRQVSPRDGRGGHVVVAEERPEAGADPAEL